MSNTGIFCRVGSFVKPVLLFPFKALHRWSRRPTRGGALVCGVLIGMAIGSLFFPRYRPIFVDLSRVRAIQPGGQPAKPCGTCGEKLVAVAGPTPLLPVPDTVVTGPTLLETPPAAVFKDSQVTPIPELSPITSGE